MKNQNGIACASISLRFTQGISPKCHTLGTLPVRWSAVCAPKKKRIRRGLKSLDILLKHLPNLAIGLKFKNKVTAKLYQSYTLKTIQALCKFCFGIQNKSTYVTPKECTIFYTKQHIALLLNLSSGNIHKLLRKKELNKHHFS